MHRQIGILLKKLASGVARSIQKGLCVTGLMLVPGVCSAKLILKICDLVVIKSVDRIVRVTLQVRRVECVSSFLCSLQSVPVHSVVHGYRRINCESVLIMHPVMNDLLHHCWVCGQYFVRDCKTTRLEAYGSVAGKSILKQRHVWKQA